MTRQLRYGLAIALLTLLAVPSEAQDLIAALSYGTFEGAYSAQYNISYWQKIPFAAPPTGPNRFRAPQPPVPITPDAIYNSSQQFDMCPQRTANGSEDCLYLGVVSRPWRAGQPLRPVVVSFYGGGFAQGGVSIGLPPPSYPILNVSADTNIVFVYPNYRTNAFGFLPGRQIAEDPESDLNVGLLDQAAALRWTQKHIRAFGGDPDQVTIWGQSAGGGSVVAQVLGNHAITVGDQGVAEQPFRRAMASSPYWPKTYRYDAPEAQALYDAIADHAGCSVAEHGDAGSLACLKRAPVRAIRDANMAVLTSAKYNTTSSYVWAPVIDGRFLSLPLSLAVAEAALMKFDAGFVSYNTHEGETFNPVPTGGDIVRAGESQEEAFDRWARGFLPGFGEEDFEVLKGMYPAVGSSESIAHYEDAKTRAGLVYRDVVLACPGLWMAGVARRESWIVEYAMSPALHASDTRWWYQPNAVQQTDPLHYKAYTGAMASFFRSGNPNRYKLTDREVPGVPRYWWTEQQMTITDGDLENTPMVQFRNRCVFWIERADKVPI